MSIAGWMVLLLVFLWLFLYSLWLVIHSAYMLGMTHAGKSRNETTGKDADDELTLEAVNASIIRTRAACSAKSCLSLDEDGLCRYACVMIGKDGKCRMMKTRENG